MTNVIEAVTSMFKTFVDNEPKPPMHVGEVMDVWKYHVIMEETIVIEQVGRNTTIDPDLVELLNEAIILCSSQSDRIKKFMEQEGIPLPPSPEDKPKSEPSAVPMGARFTDDEISNIICTKLLIAVMECARIMTECVRNDIGAMWAGFFYEHAKYGAKVKYKMKVRGWLKVPPAYYPPGLPNQ